MTVLEILQLQLLHQLGQGYFWRKHLPDARYRLCHFPFRDEVDCIAGDYANG